MCRMWFGLRNGVARSPPLSEHQCILHNTVHILKNCMSSRKCYYYRRSFGDLDMLHRRPTCLTEDPSKTNMPAEPNRNLNTILFNYTYFIKLFDYIFIHDTCWSPMGLRSDMSVSDGSPIVLIFSWT